MEHAYHFEGLNIVMPRYDIVNCVHEGLDLRREIPRVWSIDMIDEVNHDLRKWEKINLEVCKKRN